MALRKPPNAGELRHRLELQVRALGQDALGGHTSTWGPWKTVWAAMRHARPGRDGGEPTATKAAGGPQPVSDVEWIVRYDAAISASQHRAVHQGRTYNILHIENLAGQNQFTRLHCETGADRG